jgi:hypothetical protein
MANVESTRLVVGAVGQGRDLAPGSPSRHPRFHVILAVRTRAELLSRHIEDTMGAFPREWGGFTGAEAWRGFPTHRNGKPSPVNISVCTRRISSIIFSLSLARETANNSSLVN